MLDGRCPEKRKAPAVSGAPFVSTRRAEPIMIFIPAPRVFRKRNFRLAMRQISAVVLPALSRNHADTARGLTRERPSSCPSMASS